MKKKKLLIFISTSSANKARRDAIRNSWMQYQAKPGICDKVEVTFLASESRELEQEQVCANIA